MITGVQIGMIIAMAKNGKTKEIQKVIDEIMKKQFIGDTNDKGWGRTYGY